MITQEIRDFVSQKLMKECYADMKMGLSAIQKKLQEQHDITVSVGFLANRLTEYNIARRSSSESRRIVAGTPDWDRSFLSENIIEWIDGFLIGDGGAGVNYNRKIARLGCGVVYEEFCSYLVSGLTPYLPSIPKYSPPSVCPSSAAFGSDTKGTYASRTRYHPDLYKIASRWYPEHVHGKRVPEDVRITSTSVMLWYLGDGTVVQGDNTCVIRLSTDSFPKEQIEEILMPRLKSYGIDCVRTSENRIRVVAKGIPAFFNLIGRTSPIKCYNYKFNLPEWRFEAKRMSEVANDLGVSYNRLSYLVKKGKIGCYRASEKGRPRMLPEHIKQAKELIAAGELY